MKNRYHIYRKPATARPAKPRASALETFTYVLTIGLIAGTLYLTWPWLVEQFQIRAGIIPPPTAQPTDAHPAIGGQAPPIVRAQPVATAAAVSNPNVAGNDATATALYRAAVQAQQPMAAPLSSQGEPVISAAQQAQQAVSLQLAADEAAQAVRQAQLQDAAARPPDVSADQVATMTGRNPCSVPRADPHTCAQGLFKPTPTN